MLKIAIFAPALLLAACSAADASGDGSRSFPLTGFDSVRLAGSDDVRVVRGGTTSVNAAGPVAVLDRLDIRVEGSTLVISRRPSFGWSWSGKGAVVTVTMPAIRGAQLTGSGDLSVDRVDGGDFEGKVTGSGKLALATVDAATVALRMTGSGDITAAGRARTAKLDMTGSGAINAEKLVADTADVDLLGSGDVSGAARQSAAIRLTGSGDARIVGTTNCTIRKTGSGDARCG